MPKNNSPERRAARRADAESRNSNPVPLLKPCLCGKTHRAGWLYCLAVAA